MLKKIAILIPALLLSLWVLQASLFYSWDGGVSVAASTDLTNSSTPPGTTPDGNSQESLLAATGNPKPEAARVGGPDPAPSTGEVAKISQNLEQVINRSMQADHTEKIISRPEIKKVVWGAGLEQQSIAAYISRRYKIARKAAEYMVLKTYEAANRQALDPKLLLSVIAIESSFNPFAGSGYGALGLTQAVPRVHAEKFEASRAVNGAEFNVDKNLEVGAKILKEYMVANANNIPNALQQYNGNQEDKEKRYANKVLSVYSELKQKANGKVLTD